MLKKLAYCLVALTMIPVTLGWVTLPVHASAAEVGKPAPDFTATDINGKEFKLSDQKGKIVVLEWTNHECPFVVKHYSTKNMQNTQKTATDKGVVWVSIVSSAPSKQGHMSAEDAVKLVTEQGANATTRIMDETGTIGKSYGAVTTPHMFVINAEGNLAYAGAIDDNASPDPATVEGAKNLVLAAIDDLSNGRAVETSVTAPYGCGVKY